MNKIRFLSVAIINLQVKKTAQTMIKAFLNNSNTNRNVKNNYHNLISAVRDPKDIIQKEI